MGERKFRFVRWYRPLFLSERTTTVTAVLSLAVMPFVLYFGLRSQGLDLAGVFDLLVRSLLIGCLLYALRRHKLLLMQASTVGLLFCMLCAQSRYALGDLANVDSEIYITMGLQGFIFLAVEQMILFVQVLVCFNYFQIHVERRRVSTRMFINRAAILFLLVLLVVQLIVAPLLSFGLDYILHIWTLHLGELIVFVLLMCAESTLLIDSRELAGE